MIPVSTADRKSQLLPPEQPKSSLDLRGREQGPRRRSYDALQTRPQRGLLPHEILLKIATLALGKTLLARLQLGAQRQQQILQRESDRMSGKQSALLKQLPSEFFAQLQAESDRATVDPAESVTQPALRSQTGARFQRVGSTVGSPIKIRY